jgi:hypothetical protein
LELPTASVHIQELVSGQTPYSTTSTTTLLKHMLQSLLYLTSGGYIAKDLKDVK